ncbi:MAG: acyltransferase family protein [Brevundimonas sp.]
MPSTTLPAPRRHDLDWIRVGAFSLLILYHVGMFYVPWDWHVKSPRQLEWLAPLMTLTNPWRLTLLFLVSGCATRFLFDRFTEDGRGPAALAGSRLLRLAPPILFGIAVVVPPQSYYQISEALSSAGVADPAQHPALTDFWLRYMSGSGAWCGQQGCLVTPTYNHLWFVVYLLLYSLLLCALLAAPGVPRLMNLISARLGGVAVLAAPVVYLALIRLLLAPRFPMTHAVVEDWYNHALSFGAFLLGFMLARSDRATQTFMRYRRPALLVAAASWALWASYTWLWGVDDPDGRFRPIIEVAYALDQWAFIVAILGFGARWLNHGGPMLRWLRVGIFPFYIIHQTVIIVTGHHLAKQHLPLFVEATLIITATVTACWLTYGVARRVGWAGLLLGVSPARANRPPLAQAPSGRGP